MSSIKSMFLVWCGQEGLWRFFFKKGFLFLLLLNYVSVCASVVAVSVVPGSACRCLIPWSWAYRYMQAAWCGSWEPNSGICFWLQSHFSSLGEIPQMPWTDEGPWHCWGALCVWASSQQLAVTLKPTLVSLKSAGMEDRTSSHTGMLAGLSWVSHSPLVSFGSSGP